MKRLNRPGSVHERARVIRAVIDVGTNSVKALVGCVRSARSVEPVWEASVQTRLGEGFYREHRLGVVAMDRTADVVSDFKAEAVRRGAEQVRVVATSAVREAENRSEFVARVERACGVRLEVIDGDQEAEWVYRGVLTDPGVGTDRVLIVDVGGGSMECVLGAGDHLAVRGSFRLGTVRLLERFRMSDPPTANDSERCREAVMEVLRAEVMPMLQPVLEEAHGGECAVVAASGTATVLARLERGVNVYDRERLDGVVLSRQRLREMREQLWSLSLAERRAVPGMPANRADVMLTGVAIYEETLRAVEVSAMRISLRGLRYGALVDAGEESG